MQKSTCHVKPLRVHGRLVEGLRGGEEVVRGVGHHRLELSNALKHPGRIKSIIKEPSSLTFLESIIHALEPLTDLKICNPQPTTTAASKQSKTLSWSN